MQRKVKNTGGRVRKPGKKGAGRVTAKRRGSVATRDDATPEAIKPAITETGSSEPAVVAQLQDHHSMNTVQVDEAALIAEAEAAVITAEPSAAPVGDASEHVGDASPAVESWTPAIKSVMPMIRIGVLPQWDITDEESEGFAQSLGECLDQAFPGGMNGKYACWARLLIIVTAVPATRYMQHGKLPPLGPKLKAVSNEPSKTEVATQGTRSEVATEV